MGKSSRAIWDSNCRLLVLLWKIKPSPLEANTKGYLQQADIIEPLLHPLAELVFVGFGLNRGQSQPHIVTEHDVGGLDLLRAAN